MQQNQKRVNLRGQQQGGLDINNLFNSIFKDYSYKLKGELSGSDEKLLMFILAEMYRRSGGTDTAVPVEVYRQTGTGYRLHHSG